MPEHEGNVFYKLIGAHTSFRTKILGTLGNIGTHKVKIRYNPGTTQIETPKYVGTP